MTGVQTCASSDLEGELVKTDLRQSSGHQILDDAAKRIVKLAAPFSTFPDKLRKEADVIHITRSWEFLNNSRIQTQIGRASCRERVKIAVLGGCGKERAEETAKQVAKIKIDNLPADVQPSSWYIVYNGEDKPVRRLKLAVILVQDATLVFVDHLGNVVIEKDAEAFAKELENGLSGIIMHHSVFDHALNAALDSIKK